MTLSVVVSWPVVLFGDLLRLFCVPSLCGAVDVASSAAVLVTTPAQETFVVRVVLPRALGSAHKRHRNVLGEIVSMDVAVNWGSHSVCP